jgi:hypothetical protein
MKKLTSDPEEILTKTSVLAFEITTFHVGNGFSF